MLSNRIFLPNRELLASVMAIGRISAIVHPNIRDLAPYLGIICAIRDIRVIRGRLVLTN